MWYVAFTDLDRDKPNELPCDQVRSTGNDNQLDRSLILNINLTEPTVLRYDTGGVWSTHLRNER